jgi:hypothetical protein
LTPALPIDFWQSPSPPVRLRWSGSGVAQSSGEQLGDVSPRSLPQSSFACDA